MKIDTSIYSFLGKLKNGLQKANKFLVTFTLPPGINLASQSDVFYNVDSVQGRIQQNDVLMNSNSQINVFCHTCALPQRTLITYTHKHYGAPYLVPYSQQYDPVTFSFYADSEFNTRKYFEIWQSAIVNIGPNTMNYYNEFVSDVKITTISDEADGKYAVDLFEAYPLNIGMVDMSYSNTGVQSVQVTLAYRLWKSNHDNSKIEPIPS